MKKVLSLSVAIIMIVFMVFIINGCVDYGREYYFDVHGDSGSIYMMSEGDVYKESPVAFMYGKNGIDEEIIFVAKPNDGYQIKQWTVNGEVLVWNGQTYKNEIFPLMIIKELDGYNVHISVQFEPIE